MNNTIKNLIALTIAILISFAITEVSVRLLWHETAHGYPIDLYVPDKNLGYKYKPNYHGYFLGTDFYDIPIDINSKGLRDKEYSYDKGSRYRILFLGDSVTFGSGVRKNDTFESRIEDNLNTEDINFGVNGYEFNQIYNYMLLEGIKYHPDLVVYDAVLNDPNPVNITETYNEWQSYTKGTTLKYKIGKICRTCKFLNHIVTALKRGNDYNKRYFERISKLWVGKEFDDYTNKILKLNSFLEENNIRFLVVIFPYTEQYNMTKTPQARLISFLQENDIDYIDMTPYLLKDYKDNYLPNDSVHLNRNGHRIVAEILREKIEDDFIKPKND